MTNAPPYMPANREISKTLSAVLIAGNHGHFEGITQARTFARAITWKIAGVMSQSRRHAIGDRTLDGIPAETRAKALSETASCAGPAFGAAPGLAESSSVQGAEIGAGPGKVVVFILLPPFGGSHGLVCWASGNRY